MFFQPIPYQFPTIILIIHIVTPITDLKITILTLTPPDIMMSSIPPLGSVITTETAAALAGFDCVELGVLASFWRPCRGRGIWLIGCCDWGGEGTGGVAEDGECDSGLGL